ncbi:GntR family transcriptional regulator [Glutamicibacter sp. AOP12-B1-11]|uniref:GntR family transcriptional regulator n=1 Tax=Micrococcaceae TaxID=1268 RepID=UPI001C612780|nr:MULTISPECIES: GntR family transcriptional regulator [unclassified Arthrobacter]
MLGELPSAISGQRVADELRRLILEGEFKPGQRLGQEMLADRFNASRMPVREALRQLEAEGLVSIVPHSGTWVAKLDAFEFDQTYKMREVVEPLAVRESIPNLSDAQIDRLGELVEEIDATAGPHRDVEGFLRLDREFHLLTYAGVRHQPLLDLVLRQWNTTQHYRRLLVHRQSVEDVVATNLDHALILDGIRRRDPESAAAMVHLHIRRTRNTLVDPTDDTFV